MACIEYIMRKIDIVFTDDYNSDRIIRDVAIFAKKIIILFCMPIAYSHPRSNVPKTRTRNELKTR